MTDGRPVDPHTTVTVTRDVTNVLTLGVPGQTSGTGITPAEKDTINGRLTTVESDVGSVASRVYDVRDYGAMGAVGTNDTVAINSTVDAALAAMANGTRATVRLAPGAVHTIARRVVGISGYGGVRLYANQELDGAGATLKLSESLITHCAFVSNRQPVQSDDIGTEIAYVAITADLAVGATAITIASTTGFAVGDWVMLRFEDDPWDTRETVDHLYAKVVTINSATQITIDVRVPRALVVAGVVGVWNATVRRLAFRPDGVFVHDLSIINSEVGTANAEYGFNFRNTRGTIVENITVTNPGPGLVFAYCENLTLRNIHVLQSDKQSGHSAKGRGLNIWNAKGARLENIHIENFEGGAVMFESNCRGIEVDGMRLVNNHASRVNSTSTPLMVIGHGSEAHIKNLIVEGNGGCALFSNGGTSDTATFENLSIQTGTALLSIGSLHRVYGTLRIGDLVFLESAIRTRTIPFRLLPSMAGVAVFLPSGLYRRLSVYVSATTGITSLTPVRHTGGTLGNQSASLVADGVLTIDNASNYGSDYPFNQLTSPLKRIDIYTDGTVPASAYGYVEVEYYPMDSLTSLPSTNDHGKATSQGRMANPPVYTASNVTTDRAFDANVTTVDELADIVGTLIADLKQSGWVS